MITEEQRQHAQSIVAAANTLQAAIKRAERVLTSGRIAAASTVTVPEIVAYAQKISGTTSAPDYWDPSKQMVGFVPPAPVPEMMRRGTLVNYTSLQTTESADTETETDEQQLDTSADTRAARSVNEMVNANASEQSTNRPHVQQPAARAKPKVMVDLNDLGDTTSSDDDSE